MEEANTALLKHGRRKSDKRLDKRHLAIDDSWPGTAVVGHQKTILTIHKTTL